jgi:hypothetical protein
MVKGTYRRLLDLWNYKNQGMMQLGYLQRRKKGGCLETKIVVFGENRVNFSTVSLWQRKQWEKPPDHRPSCKRYSPRETARLISTWIMWNRRAILTLQSPSRTNLTLVLQYSSPQSTLPSLQSTCRELRSMRWQPQTSPSHLDEACQYHFLGYKMYTIHAKAGRKRTLCVDISSI